MFTVLLGISCGKTSCLGYFQLHAAVLARSSTELSTCVGALPVMPDIELLRHLKVLSLKGDVVSCRFHGSLCETNEIDCVIVRIDVSKKSVQ